MTLVLNHEFGLKKLSNGTRILLLQKIIALKPQIIEGEDWVLLAYQSLTIKKSYHYAMDQDGLSKDIPGLSLKV